MRCESLPQTPDLKTQIAVLDLRAGPDLRQQLPSAEEFAGTSDQLEKQIHRLRA